MAVIWSEDILTVAGKPPTRGFGGRIYFYNERSQAVPVEGELVVYGYEEAAIKPVDMAGSAADKRFRFTAEQFTQHFSESELGASYSVWIPWDGVGGFTKKITLIPAFTSTSGQLVRGEPTKVTLSGRSPTGLPDYGPASVQQVSHVEPTNNAMLPVFNNTGADGSMRTTTIELPSATTRRLKPQDAPIGIPLQSAPVTSAPIGASGSTNVRYGNGMTQEQLQAAIAAGAFGRGIQASVPNMPAPSFGSATMMHGTHNGQPQGSMPALQGSPAIQNNGVIPANVPAQPMPQSNVVQPVSHSTPASVNGFATAEFPQVDWSKWTTRSALSQPQAPTQATSQPNASLIR